MIKITLFALLTLLLLSSCASQKGSVKLDSLC
jgi:hypothetical protein